ncbi:MAG: hypothetical protein V3U73_05040, partial [bacterium]
SKICAGTMFVYLFLKILVFTHGQHWSLINSPLGYWYLVEVVGFTLIPCILFVKGFKQRNLLIIRIAAIFTLVGIVMNRLNISIIAFKWYEAVRYFPSWMEIVVTLTVILAEIWVFRWIVNRMPVLSDPPGWAIKKKVTKREPIYEIIEEETDKWKVSAI